MSLIPRSFPCTENRPCDVCDSEDFEVLCHARAARIPDYAPPVSICRQCGFVTIRPRPTPEDYSAINGRWYPFKFSLDNPHDLDENKKFRKWRVMWDRISGFYPDGPASLLDIGAGQGWAIEYIKNMFPGTQAVAIEQWKPSQEYIVNQLGADVVDADINTVWPDSLHDRFDLAIFRHTLEHLEEPLKALRQIAACLSPTGHAYIAVPNAMAIRPTTPVRTVFLRPIHLHYFNASTLTALAAKAGLVPVALEAGNEVWGLFKRAEPDTKLAAVPEIDSAEQKEFLLSRLRGTRWTDAMQEIRMAIRWRIKGAPVPPSTT